MDPANWFLGRRANSTFRQKVVERGGGYAPPGIMTLSCVKVDEREGDLRYLDPRATGGKYYRPPPEYSR